MPIEDDKITIWTSNCSTDTDKSVYNESKCTSETTTLTKEINVENESTTKERNKKCNTDNYYSILDEEDEDEEYKILQPNTSYFTIPIKEVIADAGCMTTLVIPGAPVVNIRKIKNSLKITNPNGQMMQSTHECNLDLPWLPEAMPKAHIVPGLKCMSLLSMKTLVDTGCTIKYNRHWVRIYFRKQLILQGKREP